MGQRSSLSGNDLLTWYAADAGKGTAYSPLQRQINADVCVVGGGFAGLTTALELSRKGLQVVLLEARQLGFGASGRNGGFVSPGFSEDHSRIAARVGEETARRLYEMSRDGAEYVRREIADGNPSIRMGDGKIMLLRHRHSAPFRAYGEDMNRRLGADYEFLDTEAVRARVNSDRYFAGLYSASGFHIQPLAYARLLATRLCDAGGAIYENSKVHDVQRNGARWQVLAAQGAVLAGQVVYCVSSLDRRLHRPSGRAVLPVATYVAVTQPLEQSCIRTSAALSDTRRAGDYYRLIDDDRLLWGGRITTRISRPANLARLMQRDMTRVFPELHLPRIAYVWEGVMGYAIHKMPVIGHDGQGQWFATGFGGHGLNTTAMAGELMARAIAEGDDSFRQFAAFGPQWAYGVLGRAGVQGSYWYMQLRDRFEEA